MTTDGRDPQWFLKDLPPLLALQSAGGTRLRLFTELTSLAFFSGVRLPGLSAGSTRGRLFFQPISSSVC